MKLRDPESHDGSYRMRDDKKVTTSLIYVDTVKNLFLERSCDDFLLKHVFWLLESDTCSILQ